MPVAFRLCVAPLLLLGIVASGGCDGEVAVPAELPSNQPAAGSRLRLEKWEHGSLAFSYRFFDTKLDAPCSVETLHGTTACIPIVAQPVLVGYGDEACSSLVMLDDAASLAALGEGDLVTWRVSSPEGVYRVGAPIADGSIYFSANACAEGPASPQASGSRRSLVPVPDEELVRFRTETIAATDGIEVTRSQGDDGAIAFGPPRLPRTFVGELAPECGIVGDLCVPGGAWEVFPFQRVFTDAACTSEAFHPQNECVAEGENVVAVDECGVRSLLGVAGAHFGAPAYRRSPGGACVDDKAGGPGPGEIGPGSFVACTNTVSPSPVDAFARFVQKRTTEDGLTLVQTFAGEILVAAWFELTGGQRCDAARTADGEIRCTPLSTVMPATSPSGNVGVYLPYDACSGEPSTGQALYTFRAGVPCAAVAVVSGGEETASGYLPGIARIDRFVPYEGPVFEQRWMDGFPTCTPLPPGGWFASEETSPDALPTLEHVVR